MHRESGAGSYRRFPKTAVETDGGAVRTGFDEICARLAGACRGRAKTVLTVECYPGVDQRELLQGLQPLQPALVVHSDDLAFEPEKIDALLAQDMTDDPVFGILTVRRLEGYFHLTRWLLPRHGDGGPARDGRGRRLPAGHGEAFRPALPHGAVL